ncbi:putative alpha giardin [Spironucleus salmonicida]|uniref:Alpha giardin n=1 Tax=Spironucleus salmonicida TaxID=348837 RepID=V6LKN1_9EUKA|nr:putative alpha giardin [Spironucleus salmonicida]|eukprot:EST44286.1 Putative alpha giardin [Spironucleus salmonicida]
MNQFPAMDSFNPMNFNQDQLAQPQMFDMQSQDMMYVEQAPTSNNSKEEVEQIKQEFNEFQLSLVQIFTQTKKNLSKQEDNHEVQKLNLNNVEQRVETIANSVNRALQKSQSAVVSSKIQELESKNMDMRSRIQRIEQLIIQSKIDASHFSSILGVEGTQKEQEQEFTEPLTRADSASTRMARLSKYTTEFKKYIDTKNTEQVIEFFINQSQETKNIVKDEYETVLKTSVALELKIAFPKFHKLFSKMFYDTDTLFAQNIQQSLTNNAQLLLVSIILMTDENQPYVEKCYETLFNEDLRLQIEQAIQNQPFQYLIRQWIHCENDDDQEVDKLIQEIYGFNDQTASVFFDLLSRISTETYTLVCDQFENQYYMALPQFIKQNFNRQNQNYLLLAHYSVLDIKQGVCYALSQEDVQSDTIEFLVASFYSTVNGMEFIQLFSEFGDFRAHISNVLAHDMVDVICSILQI